MINNTFNEVPTEEEKAKHIHIQIPGMPPGLNQILGSNKFWIYRIKKDWMRIVEKLAPLKPEKPIKKAIVYYIFHFSTNRRQDPDNMATAVKFLNDGLVAAGFLEDDSFDNVDIRIRRGEKSPGDPFTEIVIIDLDDVIFFTDCCTSTPDKEEK